MNQNKYDINKLTETFNKIKLNSQKIFDVLIEQDYNNVSEDQMEQLILE